jgi:membrane fusion protein, copper/silver efflux system
MTMRKLTVLLLLACGAALGAAGGYFAARSPSEVAAVAAADASAAARKVLYYRDPGGAPSWSAAPKKDAQGRDYVAVHDDEEPELGPGGVLKPRTAAATLGGARRILYYRNPMGLPDTSPVPKKDWMGMDYIPVYEGEEQDDGKTVKVSLAKVQRSGVRTETVERRAIVRPVRAAGSVTHDETRLTVVTMRSEGFVEELFVNRTGQRVAAGEPLFRVYSPDIQRAQIDLLVAIRAAQRPGAEPGRDLDGAMQRLRNLGVPEERIRKVRERGVNPRTLDWPSPASGDVIVKRIINGQRVAAGDELYRIADHSHVWVIADVAESDLAEIGVGTRATVTPRAYAARPIAGEVTFIYPELKAETRTARVRIEVPNPDRRLKIDMYADVTFEAGADEAAAVAVPASAVIDSGTRQVVLVAKGEGRFEPRPVKLGRRGDGYIEVLDGVTDGEEVVTAATFLIDAESNLKAALQAFSQPEAPK